MTIVVGWSKVTPGGMSHAKVGSALNTNAGAESSPAGPVPPGEHSKPVALRVTVMALLTGLVAQYLLGVYANLEVSFPAAGTGTTRSAMQTVMTSPALLLHMGLGFLLVAMGIAAVLLAARAGGGAVLWLALAGLLALVAAGVAGMIFVMSGQGAGPSFVMAVGFLVSFSCYFAELPLTRS